MQQVASSLRFTDELESNALLSVSWMQSIDDKVNNSTRYPNGSIFVNARGSA